MDLKKFFIFFMMFMFFCTTADAQFKSWRKREHATDCTSITDGKDADLCWEVDDQNWYKCEPTAGDCDTAGEWKFSPNDITASMISDQNAGTDITADLEEETHATEHNTGGADRIDSISDSDDDSFVHFVGDDNLVIDVAGTQFFEVDSAGDSVLGDPPSGNPTTGLQLFVFRESDGTATHTAVQQQSNFDSSAEKTANSTGGAFVARSEGTGDMTGTLTGGKFTTLTTGGGDDTLQVAADISISRIASGTTTSAYSIRATPVVTTGTVTEYRGLFLEDQTGGGTITTHWGVYQEDANANNYWAGEHFIGGTTEAGSDIFLGNDGTAVFNEQSAAVDFKIESDDNSTMFYVDGSEDMIGMGTSTPDALIDMEANKSTTRPVQLTGTVAVTNGSDVLTGTGTSFLTELCIGCTVQIDSGGQVFTIDGLTNATTASLDSNHSGNLSGVNAYTDEDFIKFETSDDNIGGRIGHGGYILVPNNGRAFCSDISRGACNKFTTGYEWTDGTDGQIAFLSTGGRLNLSQELEVDLDHQAFSPTGFTSAGFYFQNTGGARYMLTQIGGSDGFNVKVGLVDGSQGGGFVANEQGCNHTTCDSRIESDTVTDAFFVDTSLDAVQINAALGVTSVESWSNGDATPNVDGKSYFNTGTTSVTVTDFDGTDIFDGQLIYVISKGATTFDCTSSGLKCGTTDLVTASGDLTKWIYDGTDWILVNFVDQSDNLS